MSKKSRQANTRQAKSQSSPFHMQRRQLLFGGSAAAAFGLIKGASAPAWLSWLPAEDRAQAQTEADSTPRRLLHIFLRGAWDSALATDPVIGSKAASPVYAAPYQGYSTTTVAGKRNLILGAGLTPLAPSLANVPTAFINGMFIEVTAHELAANYVMSGVPSLSRTREFPALAALAGEANGVFPAHVVLGGAIPLGSTSTSAPPLASGNMSSFTEMLRGPYASWIDRAHLDDAHNLLRSLDQLGQAGLTQQANSKLESWRNAQSGLDNLYAQNLAAQMTLTPELKAKYSIENDFDPESSIPGALLVLSSGLSQQVTISFGDFDTHTNHFGMHVPMLNEFASRFNTLLEDLRSTPDPQASGLSLIDTTTVLVSSEFVRTPGLNANGGTDHWTSASAIICGRGVVDNAVIGATDDQALAMGWDNGVAVQRTAENALRPEHLNAALLAHLGYPDAGLRLSARPLAGVFR